MADGPPVARTRGRVDELNPVSATDVHRDGGVSPGLVKRVERSAIETAFREVPEIVARRLLDKHPEFLPEFMAAIRRTVAAHPEYAVAAEALLKVLSDNAGRGVAYAIGHAPAYFNVESDKTKQLFTRLGGLIGDGTEGGMNGFVEHIFHTKGVAPVSNPHPPAVTNTDTSATTGGTPSGTIPPTPAPETTGPSTGRVIVSALQRRYTKDLEEAKAALVQAKASEKIAKARLSEFVALYNVYQGAEAHTSVDKSAKAKAELAAAKNALASHGQGEPAWAVSLAKLRQEVAEMQTETRKAEAKVTAAEKVSHTSPWIKGLGVVFVCTALAVIIGFIVLATIKIVGN